MHVRVRKLGLFSEIESDGCEEISSEPVEPSLVHSALNAHCHFLILNYAAQWSLLRKDCINLS